MLSSTLWSGMSQHKLRSTRQKLPLHMESGFTSYYVYPEHMEVVFHAHDGTPLYTTPQIMPRAKAAAASTNTPAAPPSASLPWSMKKSVPVTFRCTMYVSFHSVSM